MLSIVSLPNWTYISTTAGEYTTGFINSFLPIFYFVGGITIAVTLIILLFSNFQGLVAAIKYWSQKIHNLGKHHLDYAATGPITDQEAKAGRARIAEIKYELAKKGLFSEHDNEVLSKFPPDQRKFATSAGNVGQPIKESYTDWKNSKKES